MRGILTNYGDIPPFSPQIPKFRPKTAKQLQHKPIQPDPREDPQTHAYTPTADTVALHDRTGSTHTPYWPWAVSTRTNLPNDPSRACGSGLARAVLPTRRTPCTQRLKPLIQDAPQGTGPCHGQDTVAYTPNLARRTSSLILDGESSARIRSANTALPGMFKCRPPSLVAKRSPRGCPFNEPSLNTKDRQNGRYPLFG